MRGAFHRYGSDHGCLFVSPSIPKTEHAFVLAAFEAHAKSGFGTRSPTTGMWVSEVESPAGTIIIATDRVARESFAFYSWEQ